METRGRCSDGAGTGREHSLVSLLIGGVWFALDVGRQRHLPGLFQVQGIGKSNLAITIFKNSGDLAAESWFDKLAAYCKPRSGSDQAAPGPIVDRAKKKDFCVASLEPDASRDHFGVVQDQQLFRCNQISEFAKMMMDNVFASPIDQHQLGVTTGGWWPQRNQLFGKIVIVVFRANAHEMRTDNRQPMADAPLHCRGWGEAGAKFAIKDLVPLLQSFFLILEERVNRIKDRNRGDFVSLRDLVGDFYAFGKPAENRVTIIQ